MKKLLSSYHASEDGAVYVMVLGLSLICLAFIGLMFDAGRIYVEHTRLQHFADRVALAAAVELDGKENARSRAQQVIASEALAQRAIYTEGRNGGDSFEVEKVQFYTRHPNQPATAFETEGEDGGLAQSDAEARYVSVSVKPRRLPWGLAGVYSTALSSTEFAAYAVAANTEVYPANNIEFMFAVDVSQSMLIGATQDDIDELQDLQDCAFACHIRYEIDGVTYVDDPLGKSTESVMDPDGTLQTRYEHALDYGIRFRLNAAEDALNHALSLIGDLQSATSTEVAVDVRTFARDLSEQSILTAASSEIVLDVFEPGPALFRHENDHTTDPEVVFEQLAREIDKKLLNKDPSDKLLLIILTDGVAGYIRGNSSYRRIFNADECNQLKSRNIQIAVIYLEYLEIDRFDDNVSGNVSDIAPNLESCASDGLYFKTTFEDDIFAAFEDLLRPDGVGNRPRLVQ